MTYLINECHHNIKRANGILNRLYMAGLGNVFRGIPKEENIRRPLTVKFRGTFDNKAKITNYL